MKLILPNQTTIPCSSTDEAYDRLKDAVMPKGTDRDFRLVLSSVVGVQLQGLDKEGVVDVLVSSGYVNVARTENA